MSAPTLQRDPLPPIIELGRSLAAMDAEYDRLDTATARAGTAKDARRQLATIEFRRERLSELITALPAASLMDAAVQLALACYYCDRFDGSDWHDPSTHAHLSTLHKAAYRATLSALPLVAAAAGLDMTAMGWDDLADIRQIEFGLGDGA